MNKFLSNVPPFHFVSVDRNWTESFLKNHDESKLSLSQRNCSEGTYGYKVSNVNSKHKISIFLLPFFLHHLNSHQYQNYYILAVSFLKVQSCKLYNNKYMFVSTQITNTEIFPFIAVLVFKLLSRKVLFINRKDNRNC